MSGFRSRGRWILGASATSVAMVLLVAGPASATEAGVKPSVAEAPVEPDWYATASDPPYVEGAPPLSGSDAWNDSGDSLAISFWDVNGRGPGEGQADLDIAVTTEDPDAAQITIGKSNFIIGAGTIIDVFTPVDADGEPQAATVEFDQANTFTVYRPSTAVACKLSDPGRIQQVTVIALSQNQHKYLINLDVTFGKRVVKGTKQCADEITEGVVPKTMPSPKPTKKATPPPKTDATTTPMESEVQKAQASEPNQKISDTQGVGLVLVVGLIALALLAAAAFIISKVRHRSAYENDGSPRTPADHSHTKQSKYGR